MKKINLIKSGFFAALFVASIFGVTHAAQAAALNNDPADLATLRVRNFTQNPTGNTAWYTSASANAGEDISFAIYYHNTGSDAATGLRARLTPQNTSAGTNHSFIATVWAANAPAVNGSAAVQLTSGQTIDFMPGSVVWRPNQTVSGSQSLPNSQTGSEIFTAAGLYLGDIAAGWPTQGSVVLKFHVSGNNLPPPPPPAQGQIGGATTYNPIGVSINSANLSCFFNNNNTTGTTGWFEWGTTPSLGYTVNNAAVSSPVTLNYFLSGLQQNTTYYTRCAIQNQYGINYGAVLSFTTTPNWNGGGQPLAITYPASSVYANSAVLNGYVNPNNSGATRWFEYGTGVSNLNNSTARASHGASAYAVSEAVSNLIAGQTYYYRVAAQNSYGTVYGDIQSFTTGYGARPTVVTKPATGVNHNHAVLNGNINAANANDTIRWFEWGSSASLGNSTTRVNVGGVSGDFGESIISLLPSTTYYFRAVAENSSGRVYGDILNFRTEAYIVNSGPTAVTLAASNVGATAATLNGAGLLSAASQGYGWFEWGTSANLGNTSSLVTLPRVTTAYFEERLSGLSSGTTYYYRAVVKDQSGNISRGEIMSFRVASTPVYYPPTVTQPKVYKATLVKRVENITYPNGTNTNISANTGDFVRFTIEIINTGDYKLEDAVVRDRIPDYLEFANAEERNANNPQREVSWFIGALEPGARKFMTLDMIVTDNAMIGSTIVNRATFQSRRVNADSNDVVIHVDELRSLSAKDKKGDNTQTAGLFFSLDGLLRNGFFWFNILFTILTALFTIFVVKRLLEDKYPPNRVQ